METVMALGVGHYAVKVVADSEGHGPARWPSPMRQAAGTLGQDLLSNSAQSTRLLDLGCIGGRPLERTVRRRCMHT